MFRDRNEKAAVFCILEGNAMNVYDTPEYQSFRREFDEFFCADCRDPSAGEARELAGGYSLRTEHYRSKSSQFTLSRHRLLDHRGETVYTWDNIDNDGEFASLIPHANGRHYLVFREDLYGYSVLEVETGRGVHYFPDRSWEKGWETFIWTGVRYDPRTSLLAVSGCYWACPNGTLLLDFSDPLEEQDWAEWLDIQNVVDPDLDEYDDIDLERFGPDGLLYFKTTSAEDGAPGAFAIPAEQVLRLAQEKKTTYKERE